MNRVKNASLLAALLLLSAAGLMEATLRIQQWVGPLVDLKQKIVSLQTYSEVLNHTPLVGASRLVLQGRETYGAFSGYAYTVRYDEDGIKLSRLRPASGSPSLKVLFMGDSLIEGYDDPNTIPQHAYDHFVARKSLDRVAIFLNAGCATYSPSIYIVQAKRLIPKLKPDFVVINIA